MIWLVLFTLQRYGHVDNNCCCEVPTKEHTKKKRGKLKIVVSRMRFCSPLVHHATSRVNQKWHALKAWIQTNCSSHYKSKCIQVSLPYIFKHLGWDNRLFLPRCHGLLEPDSTEETLEWSYSSLYMATVFLFVLSSTHSVDLLTISVFTL